MKTRLLALVAIAVLLLIIATVTHAQVNALEDQPPSATTPAPTREPQAAMLAQENTFAFMEQASVTDSWEALLALMRQYSLHGLESGCYADIVGDLSIGGATADVVMVLCGDHDEETVYETAGYDYDIWFDSEAYDAVKEALVKRYGEPTTIEEPDNKLVWSFRQTDVYLLRRSQDSVLVCYSLQPTIDESKPTFPPAKAVRPTPAPVQAEVDSTAEDGGFVAFMEQASLAYSIKALDKIGTQHGFTMTETGERVRLNGDLTVGMYTVLRVDAYRLEDRPGFDCYAYFAPDAYDTAKAELTRQYGEPVAMWDVPDGFVWHFAEVDISLRRSDADAIEVCYSLQSFANGFYPSFPPLLATSVAQDTARAQQAATHADASALEFMEQALSAESWVALGALGKCYGVTVGRTFDDYKYNLGGNLSIGGCTATKSYAYTFDPAGFDCHVEYKADAYDAVLEALVDRYGDPRIVWEYSPSLAWDFSEARVSLYHPYFDSGATLSYSSSDSPDASLPTFPPPQAGDSIPTPTQVPKE